MTTTETNPKRMRVFVRPVWQIYVETDGLSPAPCGTRIARGEALPTYDFIHSNPYSAQLACDDLTRYVDEFINKIPSSVKAKPVRVRADRR